MAIRVLMVTDAEGSLKQQGMRFGLTELVKALEDGGLCTVKRAHRYSGSSSYAADADITSFRFDNATHFNASNYDEIWLMGFASKNPEGPYGDPPGFELTDAEAGIVTGFMQSGGGVFAVGDHDDLGADLCAKVPRVRSMRLWTADYSSNPVPDPNKSPRPLGPYRLDTLVTGRDTNFEFSDQSDDVPQTIHPVLDVIREHVTHAAGGSIGFAESLPHPLLCGPNGVIRVLPDHMHEGRCLVPSDLTATFSLGGVSGDEYPKTFGNGRVSPEVVAWATVNARSKDPNFTDPDHSRDSNTAVNAAHFPVIVAYNGRATLDKVGRVVVDSTFHHFVNINVTGIDNSFDDEPDVTDAVKDVGFLASPEGQKHYAEIKAYWRNIARWISKPEPLRLAFWKLVGSVAIDPRLKQTTLSGDPAKLSDQLVTRYGASAWNLMTERSSPCTVFSFWSDIAIPDPLSMVLAPWVYIKLTLPDPPPIDRLREELAIDKLELMYYVIGTAMLELRLQASRDALVAGKLDHDRGLAIVRRAAAAGVYRGLNAQMVRMERTTGALKQALSLGKEIRSDIR